MRLLARSLFIVIALVAGFGPALALDISEVTSPGGIKAWFVQDRTIPLIAMNFSFKPGALADPKGKEGLTEFLTAMLDEGAGPLDSDAFQTKADALAMKMSYDASLDHFEGSFQTLTKNRDESFKLLKLALTAPRFDPGPLERVRGQLMVAAQENGQDPERIASDAFMAQAFGDDPYARDTEGAPVSLAAITAEDLHGLHKRLFTRKGLQIAVVGDIDAETLKRLLDDTFGDLPQTDPPAAPERARLKPGPSITVIDRDIPQSIITFGQQGLLRSDPDFIPAYVMSFILGGGGFGSRLTDEVREKRGLTYGISVSLYPLERAGLILGQVGTRNDRAGQTFDLVRQVMRRFAEEGPTLQELDDAKTYLTGSYALRFDSNTKIASQLLGIQQDNLGLDYVKKRNSLIEAVSLDQVKAEAKRLIDTGALIVAVVGKPEGIKATN